MQIKHARELQKDHQEVLPKDTTDRELLKKAGRYHMCIYCAPALASVHASSCMGDFHWGKHVGTIVVFKQLQSSTSKREFT